MLKRLSAAVTVSMLALATSVGGAQPPEEKCEVCEGGGPTCTYEFSYYGGAVFRVIDNPPPQQVCAKVEKFYL